MLVVAVACATDDPGAATEAPNSTMSPWPEETGFSVSECASGAQCAASPNSHAVPNVIGMRVEAACRVMLRKEFMAYVYDKKQSSEFGPGRIVLQKPKAGSVPGGPTGVFLVVSKPFPDRLPPGTSCAQRTIGSVD